MVASGASLFLWAVLLLPLRFWRISVLQFMHIDMGILLVIRIKAILISIFLLDLELGGRHLEDWYKQSSQVLCDSKSS
jgi:hypothetical protein